MRLTRSASLCILACLALTARADIQVELGNGDKVDGSISPAETETYLVDVPAGAKLIVTLKGKKSKGTAKPTMDLEIVDPADGVLFTTAGAKGNVKGKVETLQTGTHRLVVTSADTGEYQLKAKWKSPKKEKFELSLGGTPDEQSVAFAADGGALLTMKVKPSKGSDADPRFDRVDHLADGETDLPDPQAGEKGHKLKKIVVDVFGGQDVFVANDGPAGEVKGSVKIKAPKPTKRKLDLTDEVIGGDGEDGALGAVVTPGGGSVVVEDEDLGDIVGAGVDVPPGALAEPTVIVVASSPTMEPPSGDEAGAGPTVFFGPEGLEFEQPVTVLLPYDPDVFMGDFSDLQIFTRDEDGNVTLVPGPYDTSEPGVVSVMVSHFSSFRVFGPPPPPLFDLNDDGVDDLVVPAPFAGASAEGRVFVFFGPLTDGDTTAEADVEIVGGNSGSELGEEHLVADVNGDGVVDLLVGSDADPQGTVHIFLGGTSFAPTSVAGADFTIVGESTSDSFGSAIAVGEVTGDQFVEVIVGAESAGGAGRVYVFEGNAGGTFPASASQAYVTYTGEVAGDLFGAGVASGDVNGDSVDDVVIGSDQIDTQDRPGSVYVFLGGVDLEDNSADFAHTEIVGGTALGGFGLEVVVGDVTGDGIDDIVTNEGADADQITAGAVYVFAGHGPFFDAGTQMADALAHRKYTGAAATDLLGLSLRIAPLGGPADHIVALSPTHDGRGAMYVFEGGNLPPSGQVGANDASVVGESIGAFLLRLLDPIRVGSSPAVTVAAPTFNSNAGRVYVFTTEQTGEQPANVADIIIDGRANEFIGGADIVD